MFWPITHEGFLCANLRKIITHVLGNRFQTTLTARFFHHYQKQVRNFFQAPHSNHCKDTTKINSDKTFPQKSGSDAPFFLDFHPVFHIFRKIGRPTGLNCCSLPEVFCMNQQRIGEILLLSATCANAETSQTSARCAYPPTIYGTNTPHRRNGC